VVGYRLGRHHQPLADGRVPPAAGHQVEHVALAGGQLRKRAGTGRGTPEHPEDPCRNPRPEDRLTRHHGSEGPFDLLLGRTLEQVSAGAGLHGAEHDVVVLGHRQHQHGRVRTCPNDPPGGFDAVDLRHHHVHDHRVRPMQLHLPDRLRAVRRLPDDGEPVERLEERAQAAAHHRVIVDQHDSDRFRRRRHVFMMGSHRALRLVRRAGVGGQSGRSAPASGARSF
jgi:hypothetical protein